MAKHDKIGVLGAGNWGTVLALLASKNVGQVYLYDHVAERAEEINRKRENSKYLPGVHLPGNITVTSDLKRIFEESVLVLPVVPAKAFRSLTRSFAPLTSGEHILIHCTKGLEPGSHKRMSQILSEETACVRIGVLSGPTLATELAKGLPAATAIASRFDEVIGAGQAALTSSQFRVYGNREPVAVEWAGALKNVLAIAGGLIHELGLGQNALAMVVTRGLVEMGRLISAMGTRSSTLFGLAGIGDILVTCTSPLSRNFRAGQMLARGKTPEEIEREMVMVVEGLNTMRIVIELAQQKNLELPIIQALNLIAYERKTVEEAMHRLMDRPATYEVFAP